MFAWSSLAARLSRISTEAPPPRPFPNRGGQQCLAAANGLLHFGLVHDAEPRPRLGLEPLVTDRLAALLTGPVATILDALEDVLDIVELGFGLGRGGRASLPSEGSGPQPAGWLTDLSHPPSLDDAGNLPPKRLAPCRRLF